MEVSLQWTKTRPLWSLLWLGVAFVAVTHAQEEFNGPITCYECYDRAVNTTCGEPMGPDDEKTLGTIDCKRGACVKWTYYRNSVLMMERTCSEKVNMHIPLNTVCRTERNGNGYLCMCAKDYCNSAPGVRSSSGLWELLITSVVSLLLHSYITTS